MNNSKWKLLQYYKRKTNILLKIGGIRAVWKKARYNLSRTRQYHRYFMNTRMMPAEIAEQSMAHFPYQPLISIVVPLFNTPPVYFIEMVQSVLLQTYPHWQLCLADGSDQVNSNLQAVVQADYPNERRIEYMKLYENHGISGNTNAGLSLASGDYVALLDHDDLLAPNALFEMVSAINAQSADFLYSDELSFIEKPSQITSIHFKPDFAIDNLRSNNYICHLTIFKRSLLDQTGLFNSLFDGSQDYDFFLRLSESARKILHIPKVLYYWRVHPQSVANDISAKPYCILSAINAISAHLCRQGYQATVENSSVISTYRIRYTIRDCPLITIIIPYRNNSAGLGNCLASICNQTTYKNYEIIVVADKRHPDLLTVEKVHPSNFEKIKIVDHQARWNFGAMANLGSQHAQGQYLLFMAGNTEVITAEWIEEMLMFAQRSDVGAVGGKISYADNTIAHAGIGIGSGPLVSYYHHNLPRNDPGYMGRLSYAQNVTAVSDSCLLIDAKKFSQKGGFDPAYSVLFHDVDLCLQLIQSGYQNIFTPYAETGYNQSKIKIKVRSKPDWKQLQIDTDRFRKKWESVIDLEDPYYNINLTLTNGDFSIRL